MPTKKSGRDLLAKAVSKSNQRTIASRIGVTQQCVSKWLHGLSVPDHKAAAVMRDVLRIPVASWS